MNIPTVGELLTSQKARKENVKRESLTQMTRFLSRIEKDFEDVFNGATFSSATRTFIYRLPLLSDLFVPIAGTPPQLMDYRQACEEGYVAAKKLFREALLEKGYKACFLHPGNSQMQVDWDFAA